ncbi:hypothetical protein [Pseudomonas phage vB_Pa-PAC2]
MYILLYIRVIYKQELHSVSTRASSFYYISNIG